eukprot:TRINITY_DN4956_c0_g2_i1.p1 TRINITY_DN4956_c0_g2~~TRINITY_DN4956_c0_g2_i1.p1  ORF type:complete len:220 (-),score=29.76 TRINITY_DN4956_c0_g2_i1:293-952(-)
MAEDQYEQGDAIQGGNATISNSVLAATPWPTGFTSAGLLTPQQSPLGQQPHFINPTQKQQYVLPVLYGQQWYQTAAAAAVVQQNLVNQVQQQDYAGIEGSSQNKDDQEVKRERRRLSNREAARRSRKRKQDEVRRLVVKVEDLQRENDGLRQQLRDLQEQVHGQGNIQKTLIQKVYDLGGTIDDLNLRYDFGMIKASLHSINEIMENQVLNDGCETIEA